MLMTLLIIYVGMGMFRFEHHKEKDNLYNLHKLFWQSTGLCDTIVSRKNKAKFALQSQTFLII